MTRLRWAACLTLSLLLVEPTANLAKANDFLRAESHKSITYFKFDRSKAKPLLTARLSQWTEGRVNFREGAIHVSCDHVKIGSFNLNVILKSGWNAPYQHSPSSFIALRHPKRMKRFAIETPVEDPSNDLPSVFEATAATVTSAWVTRDFDEFGIGEELLFLESRIPGEFLDHMRGEGAISLIFYNQDRMKYWSALDAWFALDETQASEFLKACLNERG